MTLSERLSQALTKIRGFSRRATLSTCFKVKAEDVPSLPPLRSTSHSRSDLAFIGAWHRTLLTWWKTEPSI